MESGLISGFHGLPTAFTYASICAALSALEPMIWYPSFTVPRPLYLRIEL